MINRWVHSGTIDRLIYTQEVTGSSPVSPTTILATDLPSDSSSGGFPYHVLHQFLHQFCEYLVSLSAKKRGLLCPQSEPWGDRGGVCVSMAAVVVVSEDCGFVLGVNDWCWLVLIVVGL